MAQPGVQRRVVEPGDEAGGRREQDEDAEGDREPDEAASHDLHKREDDRCLLRILVGAARHGALRQVAGSVRIHVDQPLDQHGRHNGERDAFRL